jgi:hypothetical protein
MLNQAYPLTFNIFNKLYFKAFIREEGPTVKPMVRVFFTQKYCDSGSRLMLSKAIVITYLTWPNITLTNLSYPNLT